MTPRGPERERGAALLTVLLLVAVMGALAAAALERLRLSTALAANGAALDQARAFALGVESLLALRADDLIALNPERTTNAGGWNGEVRRFPFPGGGAAETVIRDGGNCFNLNSVAQGLLPGALELRPAGVEQLVGLLRVVEVPEADARRIALAAADWVDTDIAAAPGGAEDSAYSGYRTGNTLFADISEVRVLAGMTPDIYARLRPWLCVLPATDLSPINLNTLRPEEAVLLAMMAPDQIPLEVARKVIAERPAAGWNSLFDFYRLPEMQALNLALDVQLQPQLKTRWFAVEMRVGLRGAELVETALIDARIRPARVVSRRWGSDE